MHDVLTIEWWIPEGNYLKSGRVGKGGRETRIIPKGQPVTGRHFDEFPYPPGYRYELNDEADAPYPFSGLFETLPAGTIG